MLPETRIYYLGSMSSHIKLNRRIFVLEVDILAIVQLENP